MKVESRQPLHNKMALLVLLALGSSSAFAPLRLHAPTIFHSPATHYKMRSIALLRHAEPESRTVDTSEIGKYFMATGAQFGLMSLVFAGLDRVRIFNSPLPPIAVGFFFCFLSLRWWPTIEFQGVGAAPHS
jgi:hypothetical protein